ncbi:hypothetical protein OVA03_05840 [Asticcacaulis sp. SL142]|uniref:hypothetical protein n=1 Tax=Asticcacaulis sp. SL142 TaxID=2995155 RepID=UPI00226D2C0F|nr:hypothetical protein [Asticcacaulis sp. SL142]WAC49427.1 hypothetical protein OVA03_05840 [Asticcacaulis sp. SL142]
MEKLYQKVKEYQKAIPEHGIQEMIQMVNEIISEYDAIKELSIFEYDNHRRFQLSLLNSVAIIKKRFYGG